VYGNLAQCLGMMSFTDLPSVPSDHLVPFTDQLRLAVAAYLARFTGASGYHTESDLRCYLGWCAGRGLDPLAASRLTRPTRSGSQSQPYAHRRWVVESRAWPRRSFRDALAAGGGGGVRVDRPSPDRAGHWRGWRAGRAACRPARRPPPAGLPGRAAPPGPAGRLGPSRRARG
jgi:hypothetical protein